MPNLTTTRLFGEMANHQIAVQDLVYVKQITSVGVGIPDEICKHPNNIGRNLGHGITHRVCLESSLQSLAFIFK